MTSIENEIFTLLATQLRSAFTGIFVTSEYTPTPPKFPCVFIEEIDNFTGIYDGSNTERTSGVTFEINVFSNLKSGKKKQAKEIIQSIDLKLTDLGFRRMSLMPTPNEDTSIFRFTARYQAYVAKEGNDKRIIRR